MTAQARESEVQRASHMPFTSFSGFRNAFRQFDGGIVSAVGALTISVGKDNSQRTKLFPRAVMYVFVCMCVLVCVEVHGGGAGGGLRLHSLK